MLRKHLDRRILTSQDVLDLPDGALVTVAGLAASGPLGRAVYITLEDELGHTPLVVWPKPILFI
jgi:error-prone DNA polymerase